MPDVRITSELDSSGVKAGLNQLRSSVAGAEKDVRGSLAGMFAVGTIVGFGRELLATGGRIQDLSDRFGVGTTFIQQWGHAAEEAGGSMEGVATGLNKMIIAQSKALNGDQALQKDFAALGVSLKDLSSLSPEQIWDKISKSSMDADHMQAVFGKGALALIPILKQVADGSITMGKAIDEGLIARLAQADDRLTRFRNNFKIWTTEAAASYPDLVAWGLTFGGLIGDKDIFKTAPSPGSPNFVGPPRPPIDRETPDSSASQPSAGASTASKLAQLEREQYLAALNANEKLNALTQERADKQAALNELRLSDSSTAEEIEASEISILESDREIAGLSKSITDQAEKTRQKNVDIREEAEKQAVAVQRQNILLEMQSQGRGAQADVLAKHWEWQDKINAAQAAGNTALVEQLKIQQQLVAAANERAAAEAAVAAQAAYQQKWHEGMQNLANNLGSYGNPYEGIEQDPRVRAAEAAGYQISPWAVTMATDEFTGKMDIDALIEKMIEYAKLTDNGKNPLGYNYLRDAQVKEQHMAERQTQQGLDAARQGELESDRARGQFEYDFRMGKDFTAPPPNTTPTGEPGSSSTAPALTMIDLQRQALVELRFISAAVKLPPGTSVGSL